MLAAFKAAVVASNLPLATQKLDLLKVSCAREMMGQESSYCFIPVLYLLSYVQAHLMDFDSLPPMMLETVDAAIERQLARDVYEYAILLSVALGDKDAFRRHVASLRPYYSW